MTESSVTVVLCTAPDPDVGAQLARLLVEQHLAACVSVIPNLRSFYEWEGKLVEDSEVQLVIKASSNRLAQLMARLKQAHPYDEPEILALPVVDGSESYLRWVARATSD